MNYETEYIFSFLEGIQDAFLGNGEYFFEGERTWDFIDKLKERNIIVKTGASKLVCILEDKDYVVKIPFNSFIEDEEIIELRGATGDREDGLWDYCAREVFLYETAKVHKLDYIFPKTQYIGDIYGWPVYVQEKCIPISRIYDSCKKTPEQIDTVRKIIKKSNDNLWFFNGMWITNFYDKYGVESTIELLEFIKFYNITDLHNENVGFLQKDLKPVLIDFSGFKE